VVADVNRFSALRVNGALALLGLQNTAAKTRLRDQCTNDLPNMRELHLSQQMHLTSWDALA